MKTTPLRIVGWTLSLFGQRSVRMLWTMIGMLVVATGLSLTAQTAPSSVAGGLVGNWNFDEGSGPAAADSSGYGNDGQLADGTVWLQNQARPPFVLFFDGVNDHVNVGNSPSLNPSDEITLVAWVAPYDLSASGEIIAKSNGTDPQYYLRVQAGGKIRFGIGATVLNGNTTLSASGNFQLVAGTYDGATMKIYVNGALDAVSSRNGPMHDNGVDVSIGCRRFRTLLAFNGLIDDPQIYSRALSANEIQALATPGQVVITSPNNQTLIAGGPFNGGTIYLTADVSNFVAPVAKVEYYDYDQLIGTATQAPYEIFFDIHNLPLGDYRHYIDAVATDTLGNVARTVPGTYWYTSCGRGYYSPPSIQIYSPAPRSVFAYGDPIPIWVNICQPCSGMFDGIDLLGLPFPVHLDVGPDNGCHSPTFVWENAPLGSYHISAGTTGPGPYNFFADAVDIDVVANNLGRPANDDFANSFDLAQITVGNNINATVEYGEPTRNIYAGHSVWWHWTAPSDGWVFFSTAGSSFDTVMVIFDYAGNNVNFLYLYEMSENQFYATAGATYAILVDGVPGAWGDIQLNVFYDVPPTVAITSPAEGTLFSAGADIPVHVTAQDADGAVVQIQLLLRGPDNNVTTTFTSTATDFDYTFASLAAGHYSLTATATDNLGAVGTAWVNFDLTGARPGNDDFANSFYLEAATAGNNVNATREPGEPANYGFGHSVWWFYTAPSDGLAVFSTVGSSFPTGMAIYTGNTVDNLSLVAWNYDFDNYRPAILWFNITAGTTYYIAIDGLGSAWGNIQLSALYDAPPTFTITSPTDGEQFTAPADVPVHVTAQDPDGSVVQIELSLVALANGTTTIFTTNAADLDYTFPSLAAGNYQLIVRVTDNLGIMVPNSVVFTVGNVARPANDDFANSFDLAQITTGNNVNATLEPGEPQIFGLGPSVWWHWTAPSDGWVLISDVGSSFLIYPGIYTGSAIDNLTGVGGSGTPQHQFVAVTAGSTYQIQVVGYGASGDIKLNLHYDVPPTVSLTSPSNGEYFDFGTPIHLAATANDSDGFLSEVIFEIDVANTQRFPDYSSPYEVDWTPTTHGEHEVVAIAIDNDGWRTRSDDTIPPSIVKIVVGLRVTLTSPANGGSFVVGTPIHLTAIPDDPDGTVSEVGFIVGNSSQTQEFRINSSPYQVDWTPDTPGQYGVMAFVTDIDGGWSGSSWITISVQ